MKLNESDNKNINVIWAQFENLGELVKMAIFDA